MDEHDSLIWAAGFIDGEGCIVASVRYRKGRDQVRTKRDWNVSIYVGQVDPTPLAILRGLFGGVVAGRANASEGRRPMWMWRITGKTAGLALRRLLPYLIVKRSQAELVLAFRDRIEQYRADPSRRFTSDEEVAARMALIAQVRAEKWKVVMP